MRAFLSLFITAPEPPTARRLPNLLRERDSIVEIKNLLRDLPETINPNAYAPSGSRLRSLLCFSSYCSEFYPPMLLLEMDPNPCAKLEIKSLRDESALNFSRDTLAGKVFTDHSVNLLIFY